MGEATERRVGLCSWAALWVLGFRGFLGLGFRGLGLRGLGLGKNGFLGFWGVSECRNTVRFGVSGFGLGFQSVLYIFAVRFRASDSVFRSIAGVRV